MYRTLLMAVALLLVLPLMLFAQDGKVRGFVTDRESGEPLIGANVVLEGTVLGASTDVYGEYVILSVPPGVYTVRASYIGYAPISISNVRVSANLTTTHDIQLVSTAIQAQEIVVVAERPLIQRNTTNTIRMQTQENIRNLPIRDLQNILRLEAGVVEQNDRLYVRGGRAGEVAYFIDGANVTNPLFNSENVGVIQEAIEEFQLQAGGYTAEFGGAASGIVRTTVRTGPAEWKGSVDYRTDDFAKPGDQFLGTSAFGYRNAVVTLGGTVSSGIRLFMSGQHNYIRNRQVMFLEPFIFEGLVTDHLGARPEGEPLPGPAEIKRNFLYHNWRMANSGIGTMLFDFNQLANVPLKLKLTGSYEFRKNPNGGSWPHGLRNIFAHPNKYTMTEVSTAFTNARLTHVLDPTTFYEVGLSFQNRFARTFDQDFGDDWKMYVDSAANFAKGYDGWRTRYDGPHPYSTIYNFLFFHPYDPNNSYSKNNQSQVGVTLDFTSQVNPQWELKAGGAIDLWTIRTYSVGNIAGYLSYLDPNKDGVVDVTFKNDYERRVLLARAGSIGMIGYDIDGNEVNSGYDKPRMPLFAAAYIQNKFEYRDLVLNVGARYEYFDSKIIDVPQSINPASGQPDWQEVPFDRTLNVLREDELTETKPISYLLPRVSFSFPVTDRTVFYALYGRFAQLPALSALYISNITLSGIVSPSDRRPFNLGGAAAPFTAKPERNTQYEAGFRQAVTDNFAMTLTGFYKDLRDQLAIRRIFNSVGNPIFVGFANEDFGTVKGVELTLELRRTNRLAAKVNYTLSDARGTGSVSRSSQQAVTDDMSARFPNFISPLDYNQTHRGSIVLDYRFPKGDGGPILEGMGLNLLVTFNSGHNYTKILEPQNLGQASPWNIGVRALIDSRSRNPVEPLNASTTPWVFNFDLSWSKLFDVGPTNIELYVNVLNLLNSKHILNVYPTTGTPHDDGWLKSPFAVPFKEIPKYEEFYRLVNLRNRWAYTLVGGGGLGQQGGNDIYGAPRQIQVGLRVEL